MPDEDAKRAQMEAHAACEGRKRAGDGSWVRRGVVIAVGCAIVVAALLVVAIVKWA